VDRYNHELIDIHRITNESTEQYRQFLREKIGAHDIEMDAGPGIHLGTRDTRESV